MFILPHPKLAIRTKNNNFAPFKHTHLPMKQERSEAEVRHIITANAPYTGNVKRIPQDIQKKALQLCWQFNTMPPTHPEAQAAILKELLGTWNEHVVIQPHIHFDYGINTHFAGGHFTLVNFDSVFLDTSPIFIGENVLIGPRCVLACAGHPVHSEQRLTEPLTTSRPIHIGHNVWLGASVTVIGGVSIGDGSVIAAGAVVTSNIPAGVVAGGVPCKVIRPITEADRIKPHEVMF